MFERYNEQARRAIFFARWWALNRAAAARIEAKDLVLGIVHEKPADGSPYLQLYAQREALTGLFAAGIVTVVQPAVRDIPLSDDSKRALAYAAQEADRDGREAIDPFHLLRGVLRTGDETAQALAARGWTLEAMREASGAAFKQIPDLVGVTSGWRARLLRGRLRWAVWIFLVVALVGVVLYLRSQN
jgi:ATP-dependent Clp protease ATP-binding subunit ClpC